MSENLSSDFLFILPTIVAFSPLVISHSFLLLSLLIFCFLTFIASKFLLSNLNSFMTSLVALFFRSISSIALNQLGLHPLALHPRNIHICCQNNSLFSSSSISWFVVKILRFLLSRNPFNASFSKRLLISTPFISILFVSVWVSWKLKPNFEILWIIL